MKFLDQIFNNTSNASSASPAADLYQVDHRKFVMQHCDNKAAARRAALEASKRQRGFISGLEKIAGIEGLGKVQEALDVIVSATHVGGTEWENIVNGGANGVLTRVLGEKTTETVFGAMSDINPQGVNKVISSARQIHEKVRGRDFDWKDIPQYVSDFKNIYEIGAGVLDPFFKNTEASQEPVVACSASPYATDLIQLGAKFKFLFVVEFVFQPQYQSLIDVSPAFVVKTADRPSVSYDYEDINMYNFRSKVVKRAVFNPLSMTFYDDEQNHATAFYNAMLRLMSPVANSRTPGFVEEDGMRFGLHTGTGGPDSPAQGIPVQLNSASIGPLLGSNVSIIESVRLYHVYMGGKRVNRYTFHRPRIQSMALDGMDMAAGDSVSELRMEFMYDYVEITNNDPNALNGRSDERIDNVPGIRHPIGGGTRVDAGEGSENKEVTLTEAPSNLAEAYAQGRSYVDGLVTGATKMAGDLYTDVKSAASGVLTTVIGRKDKNG